MNVTTKTADDAEVIPQGPRRSRRACAGHPAAGKNPAGKLAFWMLLVSLFAHGCTLAPSPGLEADPEPSAETDNGPGARGWPCDPRDLDSRHCRLQAAAGFQRSADPDVLKFEDVELAATLTASIVGGPSGAGADGSAQAIMEAWQARLSPAVSWDQDPQGPVGFEVQGISGSEPLRLTAAADQTPQRFHVVSYRNPKTGSILLLEASAPQNNWQQAWSRMAVVFAEVRLTEEF